MKERKGTRGSAGVGPVCFLVGKAPKIPVLFFKRRPTARKKKKKKKQNSRGKFWEKSTTIKTFPFFFLRGFWLKPHTWGWRPWSPPPPPPLFFWKTAFVWGFGKKNPAICRGEKIFPDCFFFAPWGKTLERGRETKFPSKQAAKITNLFFGQQRGAPPKAPRGAFYNGAGRAGERARGSDTVNEKRNRGKGSPPPAKGKFAPKIENNFFFFFNMGARPAVEKPNSHKKTCKKARVCQCCGRKTPWVSEGWRRPRGWGSPQNARPGEFEFAFSSSPSKPKAVLTPGPPKIFVLFLGNEFQ